MMKVPGLYQLLQAKILTENSEVPLTPGWGQSAAPPPGGNFGKINGGSRHTVDNFGKVTLPAPRADDADLQSIAESGARLLPHL